MRIAAVVGAIVAAVAALAVPSAGSRGRTLTRCAPAGARVVAADSLTQVYERGGHVFGCGRRSRRTTLLGNTQRCIGAERVQRVALAGAIVATASERCGVDTGSTAVKLWRLSDGRRLASAPATMSPGPESYTTVTALVLAPHRAAAWIAATRSIASHSHRIEVREWRGGRVSLLDAGTGIAPGSLRLGNGRISWQDSGRRRSAPL